MTTVIVPLYKILATCLVLATQPCHVGLSGAAAPAPTDMVACSYSRRRPADEDPAIDYWPEPVSWFFGVCKVRGSDVTMPWTPPGLYDIEIDVAKVRHDE